MTRVAGQGTLSVRPMQRTALISAAVLLWLLLQVALVVWWAAVIEHQARRIATLEALQGAVGGTAATEWSRTRFMLIGESSTFVALLLLLSLLLAWLYAREHRRARAMQAFFAAVTHELRTPLTSIRLQAEAIAEGEQRVELARRLLEDSNRLESQIDKTLELARIEGGGPLSEQAVPLQGWLARTLDALTSGHGERVTCQLDLPPVPAVLADAGALQMVLRNLIDNSVRHARVQPVAVQLEARARGRHVVLTYRDNGVGVADARRLGTLFGRGPGSSGAGVGLYLVRRLMQRMGGRARFFAGPGRGFHVELWFRTAPETGP